MKVDTFREKLLNNAKMNDFKNVLVVYFIRYTPKF